MTQPEEELTELDEMARVRHSVQSERVQRFVRNMRDLREVRGWSTERLSLEIVAAGHAPITRSVLRNLENWRRATLSIDEALAIADALTTTLAWLCDYDGPCCGHCLDNPPAGYACKVCKADKDLRFKPFRELE